MRDLLDLPPNIILILPQLPQPLHRPHPKQPLTQLLIHHTFDILRLVHKPTPKIPPNSGHSIRTLHTNKRIDRNLGWMGFALAAFQFEEIFGIHVGGVDY